MTGLGRFVEFGLMVGGVALLGTVSATLASWLIETVAAEKSRPRTCKRSFGDLRPRWTSCLASETKTLTLPSGTDRPVTASGETSCSRPRCPRAQQCRRRGSPWCAAW